LPDAVTGMEIPLTAYLPITTGITSAIVAAVFIILWRLHRQFHLLTFGLSFASIALVLILRGVDLGVAPLPWRGPLADAAFIAGVAFLLAGCLVHSQRQAPWGPILAGGLAVYLTSLAIRGFAGIPGVVYLPSLSGLAYGFIAYLFLSRRTEVGNTTLGLLFAVRAIVNLPWLLYQERLSFLIHGADQHIILAIGLVLIVTELLRARNLLEIRNAELREQADRLTTLNAELTIERELAIGANHAKSEFLANMSHELRTPLNAVIGFSEVIASQQLGPDHRRYLEYGRDINTAGQHLLGIVSDVLDMARLEVGRIALKTAPVSLKAIARSALDMTRHRAEAQRIALDIRLDDAADAVEADEQLIRQALINLLSNAFKFTDTGGRVRLSTAIDDEHVLIVVEDTGIGISPQNLTVIFDPFVFSGSSATRSRGGIGLGLSITKRLVELHGGEITIASTVGQGTIVRVRLPRRQIPQPA